MMQLQGQEQDVITYSASISVCGVVETQTLEIGGVRQKEEEE